ncbi:MAG: plastocyanin/azurin family copper-binding protein [Actinomycetes bacterium]
MRRRRLRALVPLLAVLAATVLAAAPASAGGGCHAPATEGRGRTVALTDLCFTPTVLRVQPGSTVTFVNRDTMAHPLSRPGGEWGWDGGVGDRATVRLDQAGTYPFFCQVHPGMVGVVVVGDGRGTGAQVVQVDDPAAPAAATGQPASAAATGSGSGDSGGDLPSFPAAWLVLTALAALAGAAVGTRLGHRQPSG